MSCIEAATAARRQGRSSRAASWLRPVLSATLTGLLALSAGPSTAQTTHCAGGMTEVTAPSPVDALRVCEVVRATTDFMQTRGFDPPSRLRIDVVERLGPGSQAPALGHYDARAARIRILGQDHCSRLASGEAPFGLPMSTALYDSFMAHEVAHAVAQANFSMPPSVEAHEYIAYTVQFSTMDSDLRRRVIERYPVEAFADESEISSIYLGLNPAAFAIKAYLHLRSAADPVAVYRRLLSGAFQPMGSWE